VSNQAKRGETSNAFCFVNLFGFSSLAVAPMTPPAILLLAAGSSSRMRGADKLLERVDGVPLLLRQARVALAAGVPVIVTLPGDRPARTAALAGLDLVTVPVPDAALGLSASIRAGVRAAASKPKPPPPNSPTASTRTCCARTTSTCAACASGAISIRSWSAW
jgi:hypothetical protein